MRRRLLSIIIVRRSMPNLCKTSKLDLNLSPVLLRLLLLTRSTQYSSLNLAVTTTTSLATLHISPNNKYVMISITVGHVNSIQFVHFMPIPTLPFSLPPSSGAHYGLTMCLFIVLHEQICLSDQSASQYWPPPKLPHDGNFQYHILNLVNS